MYDSFSAATQNDPNPFKINDLNRSSAPTLNLTNFKNAKCKHEKEEALEMIISEPSQEKLSETDDQVSVTQIKGLSNDYNFMNQEPKGNIQFLAKRGRTSIIENRILMNHSLNQSPTLHNGDTNFRNMSRTNEQIL
jgi:hypothetical protein